MIKKIINKIKSWFTPKQEIDEHIEFFTEVPKTEISIYSDENGKAIKCGTHKRHKKSCPICREVAGEI